MPHVGFAFDGLEHAAPMGPCGDQLDGLARFKLTLGVPAQMHMGTDDKALPKQRRKELQVEHASRKSLGSALVKLADKTCNLRDMAATPPSDWPLARRQEYFDWAKRVVDALPQASEPMRRAFDEAYAKRPLSE